MLFPLLLLFGCVETNSDVLSNHNKIAEANLPDVAGQSRQMIRQDYVLQIDDSFEVKFAYNPQFNEQVTIRPDGKISLQIIDEIEAAGLTCSQLDEILTKKYSRVLRDPEIAIIVREFIGRKVYIGGEVSRPGMINLQGKMTVLEAIYEIGGFSETAEPKSVIVISRSANNTRSVRKVDLSKALAGMTGDPELFLQPYDVIHVPKTKIAEANKFVDQHLRKMIPVDLSAGFSYTIFRDKTP